MKLSLRIGLAAALALFLAEGLGVVQAQKGGRPAPVLPILLEATFDPLLPGIVADGSYQTARQVEVQIDETGDLNIRVEEHAGRSVFFDFTSILRVGTDVVPVPGPTDPIYDWGFFTMYVGGEPKVNLRTMVPGQVAPVRLWTQFVFGGSTNYYHLIGDPATQRASYASGPVQVTARDEDGNGHVDCWILEPLPYTNSAFRLVLADWANGKTVNLDGGDYFLPFRIEFRAVGGR
jgi:hypothetical protein